MARVVRSVSFDTDRDADLLAWLDAQKNQSEAVRQALRSNVARRPPEVTLEQVYQAVLDLSSKVEVGAVVIRDANESSGDAPGTEAAAKALDGLGL